MHYTIGTLVFLAVFLLNHEVWEQPLLGAVLLMFFFGCYGLRLGKRLLPDYHNLWQMSVGGFVLLSTIILLGTATYYIAFLPSELWILTVLLTPVAVWLLTPKHDTRFKLDLFHTKRHRLSHPFLFLVAVCLILLVALFSLLQGTHIFDAVRSTWERMPSGFLWLAFLLFSTLGILGFKGRSRSLTLPLTILTLFLVVSIAAFVYPLGFGFDSFLHQATENHIATFGTIDPKPLYYIGQYVAVLFTSQAFTLPLLAVDRFLIVVLTAIFLPLALYFATSSLGSDKRAAMFSTLGVFLVPLSGFIVTTPQGLANLWTLLLILLSLPYLSSREGLRLGPLWILGLTTTAIHPLAGIPALLYLLLVTLRISQTPAVTRTSATKGLMQLASNFLSPAEGNFPAKPPHKARSGSAGDQALPGVSNRHHTHQIFLSRWRQILRACGSKFRRQRPPQHNILFWLVAILGSISLPVVFIVNALVSGLDLSFSFAALAPTHLIERLNINLIFQSGFDTFLDFVYLYGANLLLLFVVIAAYILWRERHDMPKELRLPALMAVILFVNYIVMSSAINFTFLIDYERSNYSSRLLTLIFFFLTPYLALFLMRVWHTMKQRGVFIQALVIFLLAGIFTSHFYLTYPRRDNYETSRGFNTGTADLLAVDYIEEHAPSDYIVLANQQVAAGAVLRYGFKQYYDDLFYYPIPTGGDLYRIFLQMNERPTRELMVSAMSLADVNTAYYVVNDYWWQSERLIETAKTNADDWIAIDDGRVHVFRYNHVDLR